MVVTALDEIAWLLNIRGYDIPYGPFLKSYAIISKDQLHLYTDPEKLSPDVRRHLRTENCFSAHCARSDLTMPVEYNYEPYEYNTRVTNFPNKRILLDKLLRLNV